MSGKTGHGIPRRQFLIGSAASGAGALAFAPGANAALGLAPGDLAVPLAESRMAKEAARYVWSVDLPQRVERAVRLSIANICAEGLDDILPRPFEVDVLAAAPELQDEVSTGAVSWILDAVVEGRPFGRINHVAIPKRSQYHLRRCAVVEPLDSIRYLALAVLVAETIEAQRLPATSWRVFSYRYRPANGLLFDRGHNFRAFRAHVARRLTDSRLGAVVCCDIANFYGSIALKRLGRIMVRRGVTPELSGALIVALRSWAGDTELGLPVGSNASRILAEASLLDTDDFLIAKGIDFARFVDDYRLFAPDFDTANVWLDVLAQRLAADGFALNPAKTRIREPTGRERLAPQSVKLSTSSPLLAQGDTAPDGSSNSDPEPDPNSPPLSEPPATPDDTIPELDNDYARGLPLNFYAHSDSAIRRFVELDLAELSQRVFHADRLRAADVIKFVNASFYQGNFAGYAALPDLLDRAPRTTPYVSDLLIKQVQLIPAAVRQQLRTKFGSRLAADRPLPDYVAIHLSRLLGSPGYRNSRAVLAHFRRLDRTAWPLVARAALDALYGALSEKAARAVARRYLGDADPWQARAIIRMLAAAGHDVGKEVVGDLKLATDTDPIARAIAARPRAAC